MVCLGVRPVGQWPRHLLGRETLLTAVRWTADDWPVVGERGVIAPVQPRPALPVAEHQLSPERDDFDEPRLGAEWAFVRRPLDPRVIHARPGWLTLTPASRLDERLPCFVGRRQQHYDFIAETRLVLNPSGDGDEGGIAVRMNEDHFYSWCLRSAGASTQVVLTVRLGRLHFTSVVGTVDGLDATLSVQGDAESYVFTATDPTGRVVRSDPLETKFLSPEVAGGFTGVFLGVYAATSAPGRGAEASFDWFDYRPAQGPTSGHQPVCRATTAS